MPFDLLPSLHPRERRATICVRVSRKWEYRGGTDDGPIQHVDLVLIDEKGNSMYGEIPASEVDTKSRLIEENGIYVISRFRVSNAKHTFRPVDSPFMVEFTYHTKVSAAREETTAFPLYAYRITPIGDLESRAGDTRDFVDTIGMLIEVSDPHMVRLPNKPRPTLTRHILLRDLSYSEIKVTLWGERAAAFTMDQVPSSVPGKPPVVLIVGGLMKKYQDNYYLSANTAARWYFNPRIPEAKQFYNSFQEQFVQVNRVAAPVQPDAPVRGPSDLEEKTLLQLNQKDAYDFEDDGYRCTVTIGRLVPNTSWWFASCTRCSRSCTQDGATYRCNSCSSTSFRFKYKICFVALDGTDEAEMICFGDVGRQIVGKPVQQVLRSVTPANRLPADITRIVSRKFTFTVTLTQQSYYRQEKTYQVTSVIASHAQHEPNAAAAHDGGGVPPGENTRKIGDAIVHNAAPPETRLSSHLVSDTEQSPPSLDATPPPETHVKPPPKEHEKEPSETDEHPKTRRKLLFGKEGCQTGSASADSSGKENPDYTAGGLSIDEIDPVLAGETSALTKAGEKKRSRSQRGAAH